ncbi:unnamed protein product [Urochloa humidicola]
MKVQCDVCASEAASVFCCADEAALCDACDRRVHRANKLAGKHRRFSLLNPAPPSSLSDPSSPHHQQPPPPPPLCDICQEKRGLLFCKEDRAILCRDCDVSVHTASELTMRHTRFLLTGVRLSAEPAACPAPSSEEENSSGSFCCSAGGGDAAPPSSAPANSHGSDSSSISEYLTKTLPGWHVEDFLVDEATAAAAAAAANNIGVPAAPSSYQGGLARIGGMPDGYSAWMAQEQLFGGSAAAGASREQWVPQMMYGSGGEVAMAGSKRSRTATAASLYSYW